MKFVFLFLHLLLLWTCAFAYAQEVSYFSILHNFYHSAKKCGEWHEICFSLSPLTTFVNLCIPLCSGSKLLFLTFIILTKSVVSDMKFVFLLFHLLLCERMHLLMYAQLVSYFSILHNFYHSAKKSGEWHEISFSFSTYYFCELVHSLMLRR